MAQMMQYDARMCLFGSCSYAYTFGDLKPQTPKIYSLKEVSSQNENADELLNGQR
jgi:hypothetical protein